MSDPGADLLGQLLAGVDEALPRAAQLRRALHQIPETGGREFRTRALIAQWLPWASLTEVAGTGLIARVGPGPDAAGAVGIRAELDALPIREETGVAWAATGDAMHACGHDVHLAATWAVLEAARSLDLPGGVVGLFQPREETQPSGARDLVRAGVLTSHRIAAVVGAHVQPQVPFGEVSTGAGAVNAAFDEFEIVIRGRGGHGAYPHTTVDPVPILANIVTATHELVSRTLDPTHPALISIGRLEAGDAANVIAATARCAGTLRTFSDADRAALHAGLRRLSHGLAQARGATAEVTLDEGGPALINDADLVARTDRLLARAGLTASQRPLRSCGADDFSYYAQVPILMMFIGTGAAPGEPGLHHARFLPTDETLAHTARALACAVVAGFGGRP